MPKSAGRRATGALNLAMPARGQSVGWLVRSREVPTFNRTNDLREGAGKKVSLKRKRNFQRRPHPPRTWVYIIGHPTEGPVKIGVTKNAKRRLQGVQTVSAHKLTILARFRGDKADEARIHERFKLLRLEGEWFERNTELAWFIKSIRDRQPLDQWFEASPANEWDVPDDSPPIGPP